MTSSPTALVPWMPPEGRDRQALASTTEGPMQKSCASPMRWSVRNKWLIATSVLLAVGAGILGSLWLGLAAVLPLIYVLPCLALAAMRSDERRSGDGFVMTWRSRCAPSDLKKTTRPTIS